MAIDMSGKTCVVTGANSGIGFITARELARRNADVTLVCRNEQKGRAAQDEIRKAVDRDTRLELADFASLDAVQDLALRLRAQPPIDVLVNNAGLMATERSETVDGFEYTFAVNHLAPFLLTNLLLDRLRERGEARIVNVASRAHSRVDLDLDDLQSEKSFGGWNAYCRSKLCNVLFSAELARRIDGTGVTSNALHPGVIASGFGRENRGLWKWAMMLARIAMVSPEEGAKTQIHLATSDEVRGTNGAYFVDAKPAATSAQGADPELARKLWEASEKLVELSRRSDAFRESTAPS